MLRIVITFGAASTTIWGTATIMRTDATEIKASHAGATRGCDVENETLNDQRPLSVPKEECVAKRSGPLLALPGR
jgi:hypothetical protein